MSVHLFYKPIVPVKEVALSDVLKRILSKVFWANDGSTVCGPTVVDAGNTMYLRGLADAGVLGAEQLLKDIEKYGAVELYTHE